MKESPASSNAFTFGEHPGVGYDDHVGVPVRPPGRPSARGSRSWSRPGCPRTGATFSAKPQGLDLERELDFRVDPVLLAEPHSALACSARPFAARLRPGSRSAGSSCRRGPSPRSRWCGPSTPGRPWPAGRGSHGLTAAQAPVDLVNAGTGAPTSVRPGARRPCSWVGGSGPAPPRGTPHHRARRTGAGHARWSEPPPGAVPRRRTPPTTGDGTRPARCRRHDRELVTLGGPVRGVLDRRRATFRRPDVRRVLTGTQPLLGGLEHPLELGLEDAGSGEASASRVPATPRRPERLGRCRLGDRSG